MPVFKDQSHRNKNIQKQLYELELASALDRTHVNNRKGTFLPETAAHSVSSLALKSLSKRCMNKMHDRTL